MRRLGFYLVLMSFIISCDVFYEDNKRLYFAGTVIDEEGIPIKNIPVEALTYGPTGISYGQFIEVLGEGVTDENGNFNLVTLSPEGDAKIVIDINDSFQKGYQSGFATASLIGLETLEALDAAYRLNQLGLERIINSKLSVKRSTNTADTLFFNVTASSVQKMRYFGTAQKPETPEFSFFPTDTLYPSENTSEIMLWNILAKDTLLLEYRLKRNSSADIFKKKLTFIPETGAYEFEF